MKTKEIELMCCLFCASTKVEVEQDYMHRGWYVKCNKCFARGSMKRTEEDAKLAWNRDLTIGYE